MKSVLDTSFFFYDIPADGELYTTPSVREELIDFRSKGRFDVLSAGGLIVREPSEAGRKTVVAAAAKTGDTPVISDTDRDVLALALDFKASVYTDDFAVMNIAGELRITVVPLQQRPAEQRRWKFRCRGCGRYYSRDGDCPVCGAEIKRKLK